VQTENAIVIQADVMTIYQLAAAVERWPALLPHYRSVRVLRTQGNRRLVAMAAYRDGIPISWWAEQTCDPTIPRITFHHVRGVTRGMDVEWRFDARPDGVHVAIHHDLRLGWPLVGGWVADRVIGPFFIANVAGKTLRRIKLLAESAPREIASVIGS
jgi:uncharacterized membrane protein